MSTTLQGVADLLNAHIQKFQARHELLAGGQAIVTTQPNGQQVRIPLQTGRTTTGRRQIR